MKSQNAKYECIYVHTQKHCKAQNETLNSYTGETQISI